MKKRTTNILIIMLILISIICLSIRLITNKTFFKTKYIGIDNQEIFIPKYSFFKSECCMTAAEFYSIKSKKSLQKEIDNYMKDFKYFSNETTYGYLKGDLFIQNYQVIDKGLYRKIVITY